MQELKTSLLIVVAAMLVACGGSGSGDGAADPTDPANPFTRDFDPGSAVAEVITLPQNWNNAEAIDFYNGPQGSRLIPYRWFLLLEQADSQLRFSANAHLRSFGYLTRFAGQGNPDGLPIGFIRDAFYADGTPGLGFTCAACHTAQINFTSNGLTTAMLIDGAPGLGDLTNFLRALERALRSTLSDQNKFSRFVNNVIPGASSGEREALRSRLAEVAEERRLYNELNLPLASTSGNGHGRADAFGAIMNQVAANFLVNPANAAAANAPVSYPFLWDTAQHDFVQWNGSGINIDIPAGEDLAGTRAAGALLRNAAQVLGVFGDVDPSAEVNNFGGYRNTVNFESLVELEKSVSRLWSPQWPALLGAIDQETADAGAVLYAQYCQSCHQNHKLNRTDPSRSIKAQMHDVGTDPGMAKNYASRSAETGVLAGRFQFLATAFTGEPLAAREPMSKVMIHMALRALAGPDQLGALYSGGLPSGNIFSFVIIKPPPMEGVFPYKARPLNGIWATAPFLHNGSVPNLWELLKSPTASQSAKRRAVTFFVGDKEFDPLRVGFRSDQGPYLFDTTLPGNSNSGHAYGTELSDAQKWQLIEYIKTL